MSSDSHRAGKRPRSESSEAKSSTLAAPPAKERKLAETITKPQHEDKLLTTLSLYAQLRQHIEFLITKKKQIGAAASTDTELREALSKIEGLFLVLKKMHRDVQMDTEAKKEATMLSRNSLNDVNLELQNLYYEKNHYMREIQACYNYKAQATKAIDLVPIEQFQAEATDAYLPKDDDSEHEIMMKRLNHELQSRLALKAKLNDVKRQKKEREDIKAQKNTFLHSLKTAAVEMEAKIKPMLPELGITEEVETTQTLLLSRLLPAPLYTLFWHLDAWKTSTSDAIVLEVYPDGTTDKKTIEGYLTKLNQTKLDQCSVEQQYQFHPLSVVLRVTRATDKKVLLLAKFHHVSRLDFCVSHLLEGSDILSDLFPNDLGNTIPNPKARYLFSRESKMAVYDPAKGRTYNWLQWLCGYRFYIEPETVAESVAATTIPKDEEMADNIPDDDNTKLIEAMDVDVADTVAHSSSSAPNPDAPTQGVVQYRISDILTRLASKLAAL